MSFGPVTALLRRRLFSRSAASMGGIGGRNANQFEMKRLLILALVVLLVLPGAHALAGKKKKGPKPYKSDEVTITVPHGIFYTSTGDAVNVTIQEFKNRCALPASQGLDAHIFEVPADYQKIDAATSAIGAGGTYDLDLLYFDSSCAIVGVSQAVGTDEQGFMPAGTVWIALYNYLGPDSVSDPNVSAYIELKPV